MIYPMAPNGIYRNWDNLGDGLGVLMYDRKDTTVVNLYETEEYKEYLSLIRDWNQKGYLYDLSLIHIWQRVSGCSLCFLDRWMKRVIRE